jgi:asparagine synthase (glutamine-hydrolysing)
VERRLRSDVPVVSYLSGGIDSSLVVAMAARLRGGPIPTFTIRIPDPRFDETERARATARRIGSQPVVVPFDDADAWGTYPELTRAAEFPVVDTSSNAILMLARAVHQNGYKVALTGEGADEWLAGYPWHKFHRLGALLDGIPGLPVGRWLRRQTFAAMGATPAALAHIDRTTDLLGDHTGFQELYSMMSLARWRFYSAPTLAALADHSPYEELEPDLARTRGWHPLNRGLYWGARVHLAGHLLASKGDRVALNSSVETRYPFLDEAVCDFLARLHPRWKMRGLREKYLLRLLAERYLPKEVAWRRKGMFRAPMDGLFSRDLPEYADQLLSAASLRRTGYFDPEAVQRWRQAARAGHLGFRQRASVQLGLIAVFATQLWHHTFIDAGLADLPAGPRPQLVTV